MKYSILIPAYKSTYFKECIESIISQTFKDFEIIIVDDASPENLQLIVNEFNDKRIKYYRNDKNCGAVNVVDNWNICLNYSSGDYIICMGDDDKLLPNCLEEYNILIASYPDLNIYHGWTEVIDENSKVYKMQEARPIFEGVFSLMWHRLNGRIQFIGDFLYKSSFLKDINGFYKLPLAWGSDDITAYIAAKEKGVANTQHPVFQYRENRFSITNSGNIPLKLKTLLSIEKWCMNFILHSSPTSLVEEYFQQILIRDYSKYVSHDKSSYLYLDFKSGRRIFKLWFWLIKSNEYSISLKNIGVGFIKSLFI